MAGANVVMAIKTLARALLEAPFVTQTAFGHQTWAPGASNDQKRIKNNTKEPPDCEKELPKSSLFGALPGGLRTALSM